MIVNIHPPPKHRKNRLREIKRMKCVGNNLIFVSAGDNTNFYKLWTKGYMDFDILVVYYGDNNDNYEKYRKISKFITKRKGSKFQNLHHIYNTEKDFLLGYERIFVLDDDIIISTEDLNNMFKISKKYNLDVCAPTFKKSGKISHPITISRDFSFLRYTNFVEVNTPLFKRSALDKFMKYYDPILIGWGIDYFYIWIIGCHKKRSYALIDCISCINPKDKHKISKNRELLSIKGSKIRSQVWNQFKKKNKIKCFDHRTWCTI